MGNTALSGEGRNGCTNLKGTQSAGKAAESMGYMTRQFEACFSVRFHAYVQGMGS